MTDDAGVTWSPCAALDGNVFSNGIEVAADGSVLVSGSNVLRSTDGCATWTVTGAPTASLGIGVAAGETYMLGDAGLHRFTSPTWTPVPTPLDGSLFTCFGHAAGGAHVAGTYLAGLVVSADGTSWTQKTTGFPTLSFVDVAASPARTYALTGAVSGVNGGVSCSDGTGATWTTCLPRGGTAMALDPLDDQHVVVATYDDLGETTDAFAAFTDGLRDDAGLADWVIRDLHYTTNGTLLAASDRGVFAATGRPLAFVPRHTGLDAWTVKDILVDGADTFIATDAGVLRSVQGEPFTLSTAGLVSNTEMFRLAFAPDGTLLAPGRAIWASTDRAQTWSLAQPLADTDGFRATVIAFDGTRAFAGTFQRVLRADPPYTAWSAHLVGGNATRVHDLAAVGGQLYIAAADGLFVSGDGATSSQVVAGIVEPSHAIAALPDGGIVVATDAGLRVSDPTRSSFMSVMAARAFEEVVLTGGRLLAVDSTHALHTSTDRGVTWTLVSTPAGVGVRTATVDPGDGSIVAGTYRGGLVRVAEP